MGGRNGRTRCRGDIAECGAGWDQAVRTGMGGPGASEGMSGAFDRGGAEECQGKIVEFVQDDCGVSAGARKPAKMRGRGYFMGHAGADTLERSFFRACMDAMSV